MQVGPPSVLEPRLQRVQVARHTPLEAEANSHPRVDHEVLAPSRDVAAAEDATHTGFQPEAGLSDGHGSQENTTATGTLQPATVAAEGLTATLAAPQAALHTFDASAKEDGQVSSLSEPASVEDGQTFDVPLPANAEGVHLSDLSDEEGQCSPHQQQALAAFANDALPEPLLQAPYPHDASAGQRVEMANKPSLTKPTKTVPLAQRLNPNNAAFDAAFAEQHRAKRMRTDTGYAHSIARKEKKKLLKRVHWSQKSALSAKEHCYLVDLSGKSS